MSKKSVSDTNLPDATEITQVKDVMELSRSGQHLDLGFLPESSRSRYELVHSLTHLRIEAAFLQYNTLLVCMLIHLHKNVLRYYHRDMEKYNKSREKLNINLKRY